MADKKDEKDRKDLLESAYKEYDNNELMYSRGKKTKEATERYEKNRKQILGFIEKIEKEGMSSVVAARKPIYMESVAVKGPREIPTVAFEKNVPHPANKTIHMDEINIAIEAYRENELKFKEEKITKEEYQEKKRDILEVIDLIEKGGEMPIMAAKQAPTTRISMEEIAVKGPKEPPTVAFGNNMPHPARKTINMEEIKVAAAAPKNKGKAVAKD